MKLKQSVLYQLWDCRVSVCVFYCIVLCVWLLAYISGVSVMVAAPSGDGETALISGAMNGMELATLIFLFVVGLNVFTENFAMLIQNGVTRRTFFVSHLAAGAIISICMAVIDRVLMMISYSLGGVLMPGIRIRSLFDLIYFPAASFPTWIGFFGGIGYYFLFPALGFCIVLLFKRLSKTGRIAVAVGVPVTLGIVLPVFDELFFGARIFYSVARAVDFLLGISAKAPLRGFASTLLLSFVLWGLAWLMVRRIPLKK